MLSIHLESDLLVHVLAQLPPHQFAYADLKEKKCDCDTLVMAINYR